MGQSAIELSTQLMDPKRVQKKEDRKGISFGRYFAAGLQPGRTPYDDVSWETRTAAIGNDKGAIIFEQRDIETPVDWSQTATNIVASKYFYGKMGTPERETTPKTSATSWRT